MPQHFRPRANLSLLLAATAIVGLADPAFGRPLCPKGMAPYTLHNGDTCNRLFSMQDPDLNFTSIRQIEKINKPLFRFICAKARDGQLICHPLRRP